MTTDTPVSLSTLLQPSRTVKLDVPGFEGFQVDLCFLAREELLKLKKRCESTKFDRRTHQPVTTLDDEKFLSEYCKAVVKGWNGLTYAYLEQLILVDVSSYDLEDTLPFTDDNVETLMKNSSTFDTWVTEESQALANFTQSR